MTGAGTNKQPLNVVLVWLSHVVSVVIFVVGQLDDTIRALKKEPEKKPHIFNTDKQAKPSETVPGVSA